MCSWPGHGQRMLDVLFVSASASSTSITRSRTMFMWFHVFLVSGMLDAHRWFTLTHFQLMTVSGGDLFPTRKMAIANKTCVSGKKAEGWRYVVEAFYLYAKLIFGRPLYTRQFCVYTKDRKLLSQKEAVYQHTCINAVKIFVRIFSLLIYSPRVSLYRPNNVEFGGHAEKSISNELSTAIWTFLPPLVTPLEQSR